MHHYPHHVGDYAKDTPGLTMLEHGAYRLLMDAYYAGEAPIPDDEPYAIAKASNPLERKAVEKVLRKFFVLRDGHYHQKRIDEELEIYQEKAAKNRENGKLGGRPRNPDGGPEDNPEITQTVIETEPRSEPKRNPEITLTNSQEPITKKQLLRASRLPGDWTLPEDWRVWTRGERPHWDDAWITKTASDFHDFWLAAPKGQKLDWLATWRKWVRNSNDPKGAPAARALPRFT